MKKFILFCSALFLIQCAPTQNQNTTNNGRNPEISGVRNPTNTDRSTTSNGTSGTPVAHNKEFIQNYFNETYSNLEKAVSGLSDTQLNFKTSPDRWSILECLEHIVVSEPKLFEMEKATLKNEPTPNRKSEITVTDDQVMTMLLNRSFKATAPAEMVPSGKYKNVQTALSDLKSGRITMLKELDKFSLEDLRNRIMETPIGLMDAYQFMLFLPGHTARHTLQIQEIKADANFPKN